MRLEHIAVWVENLEKIKDFYMKYFQLECSDKYVNTKKEFSSYFLSFGQGARIELMHNPDIQNKSRPDNMSAGITHLAISVGNRVAVDELTEQIRQDGHIVSGEPRTTGDGCYESVILDPEGNIIEITE